MSAFTKGCAVAAIAGACVVGTPNVARESVCTPQPLLRTDGTVGRFNVISPGQEKSDPAYAGAVPAFYDEGKGLTCDNQDGYVFTGHTVGSDGKDEGGAGDIYPYYVKQ